MTTQQIPKSKAKNAFDLLSEVQRLILAEPKRYNQAVWLSHGSPKTDPAYPSCGTIGCVAGWVATLKGAQSTAAKHTVERATEVLGLSKDQVWDLFDGGALDATARPGTLTYARAGVRHIRRFQKAHREQLLAKKV